MLEQTKSPVRRALVTAAIIALAFIGLILLFAELLAKYESQQCTLGAAGPVAGVPAKLAPIYEAAGSKYNLGPMGPAMLAGVNYAETSFGTNLSTSSTGAEGWMQFEPGTWAQYGVSADPSKPGAAPDPYDPWDAIFAAANLLRSLGAPGNWWQAIYMYGGKNPAEANEVTGLARGYYQQGLERGGGSQPQPAAAGSCGVVPGQYANPFAATIGLTPQRIDMGVDYDGSGRIDALGNARITFAGTGIGGGWVCSTSENGGVVYQVLDGPYQGRYIYTTEDVVPSVHVGQTVAAGQPIASFTPNGCIETGFASGPGPNPEAAALGQQGTVGDAGANRTYCGQQMSDLLASTGAPAGVTEGKPVSGNRC